MHHASIESSGMLSLYTGITQTGPDGYAVVTLPAWFESLNTDFRYQLTVVDESDAGRTLAKVVSKIQNGQFTIRTSAPNMEVSWQVTDVRQDAWALKHRMQVEKDKEPQDRGKLLYPEAYALPVETGIVPPSEKLAPSRIVLPKKVMSQPSGPAALVPAISGGK